MNCNRVKHQILLRRAAEEGGSTAARNGMRYTAFRFDGLLSTINEFTKKSVLGESDARMCLAEARGLVDSAKQACRADLAISHGAAREIEGIPGMYRLEENPDIAAITTKKEASGYLQTVMIRHGVYNSTGSMASLLGCTMAGTGGGLFSLPLISSITKNDLTADMAVLLGVGVIVSTLAGTMQSTARQLKDALNGVPLVSKLARPLSGLAIGALGLIGIASIRHIVTVDIMQSVMRGIGGLITVAGGLLVTVGGIGYAFRKRLDGNAADELKKACAAKDIFTVLGRVEKELGKVEKQI
jgi:hypothetical protein